MVGTACECVACKNGTTTGYYAKCPSCAKDYLGALEDKPIKCYCGMTYQIVKELTPVIHPLDNLMTSNIVTDINGAVTSVTVTNPGNGYISANVTHAYVCICNNVLSGMVLDTVECPCGKFYLVTEKGPWTWIPAQKIKPKSYHACPSCSYPHNSGLTTPIECLKCNFAYDPKLASEMTKSSFTSDIYTNMTVSYVCIHCNAILKGNPL